LGAAAFTPSALALAGESAPRGRIAYAYGWYSSAHYGAIAVGPFLGGVVAEWWGYRTAFVVSGAGIVAALLLGMGVALPVAALAGGRAAATVSDIRHNRDVWAGWIIAASGLFVQGVVFVFLVLGAGNTLARFPSGWLVDRTGRPAMYAVGGVVVACGATVMFPRVDSGAMLLAVAALFGLASGVAFVAISTGLAAAAPPNARGLVMGGYSTALYLGFGVGSIAVGPVITHGGHATGFVLGGALGLVGVLFAALLWRSALRP